MQRASVSIAKGRARPFWFGCPVVFSGSVSGVSGNPGPGDMVDVVDDRGQPIGCGFFNPNSSYRVRIVGRPGETGSPEVLISERIGSAAALRARMGLPSAATTVYRLFNSEGDGLSGVTVDIFGGTAVVMESALWVARYRETISMAVRKAVGEDTNVLFRVAGGVRGQEGITAGDQGEPGSEPIIVAENGLKFTVRPGTGQKTGFYADQRENRLALRDFVRGAEVLDLFSFSGGFALNAAAGGAARVVAVDSSADAVAAGHSNASINGMSGTVTFFESDVMNFLSSCSQHDVVVCDPPKLASGRSSLEAAMKHYFRLNVAAMRAVRDGGVLVTCSCSSAVRRDMFIEMIRDAAMSAGRSASILRVAGAAADHPVSPSWTEGEYLKVVTMSVRGSSRA